MNNLTNYSTNIAVTSAQVPLAFKDVINNIVTPTLLCFALSFNLICILALRKRSKEYLGYVYQMLIFFSDFCCAVGVLLNYLRSPVTNNKGPDWMNQSYVIVYFVCHFVGPLFEGIISWQTLLLVGICFDRFIALRKPLFYKNSTKYRRYFSIYLWSIVVVSFSLNIHDVFRMNVISDGNNLTTQRYFGKTNSEFVGSLAANVLNFLPTTTRIVAAVAIVVFNLLTLRAYRKYTNNPVVHETVSESKRRQEKMITKLIFVISVIFVLCHMYVNVLYLLVYALPGFNNSPTYANCGIAMKLVLSFLCFINNVTYSMLSQEFRTDVVKILATMVCCGNAKCFTTNAVVIPLQSVSTSKVSRRRSNSVRRNTEENGF